MWSGPINLLNLTITASYPSSTATALSLFAWWVAVRALDEGKSESPGTVLGLIVLTALLVTTHQLSGLFGVGGIVAFTILHPDAKSRSILITSGIVICGLLLGMAWPYYNYLSIFTSSATETGDWAKNPTYFQSLSSIVEILGPATLGLIWVILLIPDKRYRALSISAVVIISGTLVMANLDMWYAHRMLPFIAIFLQLSLVVPMVRLCESTLRPGVSEISSRAGHWLALVAILTLSAILVTHQLRLVYWKLSESYAAVANSSPADPHNYLDSALAIRQQLPMGTVVFATEASVFPIQGAGIKVVSLPRPAALILDHNLRQRATEAFFAEKSTEQERLTLAREFNAPFAVLNLKEDSEFLQESLSHIGLPTIYGDRLLLIDMRAPLSLKH